MNGLRAPPPAPFSIPPLFSSALRFSSASACILWISFFVTSTSVPARKLSKPFFLVSASAFRGTKVFSAPTASATSWAPAATPIQAP
jgi:hypothetical protein